jgi:hypothetical protein
VIDAVGLRPASPADRAALNRLAELDCATRVPPGRVLVAESGGTLRAALSIDTGEAIADPFVPTTHLVAALRAHAASSPEGRRWWTRPSQPMPAT